MNTNGEFPPAVSLSGTIVMIPHEWIVRGFRRDSQTIHTGRLSYVQEHYPCTHCSREEARRQFNDKYYAAGVRGTSVDVLYRMDRMH